MSRQYFDMTKLVDVATAQECIVHIHIDEQGHPVFSVGNQLKGAVEFTNYRVAMETLSNRKLTADDCAERDGAELADGCLESIRKASSQAERVNALQAALLGLQRLPHPEHAAGGFAVAMVAFIEVGLGVDQ